jgi:hypothetical protein
MWDGSIKEIQHIKVGEKVIGDRGYPRIVTSIVSGEDQMYLIKQINGDDYTVTSDHIMCFVAADHCRIYFSEKEKVWILTWFDRETMTRKRKQFGGEKKTAYKKCLEFLDTIDQDDKIDMTIQEYMALPQTAKNLLYAYKCNGIVWPQQKINIDPYILGMWLGDGDSSGQGFTSADQELIDAWIEYAESIECQVNASTGNSVGSCYRFNISGSVKFKNHFLNKLKEDNLLNNKHIPKNYLCNSRDIRLKLLAGLIDTDSNLTHDGHMIRFNQGPRNIRIFEDVVILVRSLGFKCCVRESSTSFTYKNEKKYSTAKFLTISGDIDAIPTRIPRKKCMPQNKKIIIDRLRTKFSITPVSRGKYVGINVTGNNRFLLADCTVVHNCLDHIRNNPKAKEETNCIVGPDGDLIMLCLSAHVPNIYLFKEDQFDIGYFYYIDMGIVRKRLSGILGQTPVVDNKKRMLDEVTDDFILLGFFVGNDFLPKIQMFMFLEDGLEMMINICRSISKDGKYLTVDGRIDHQSFTKFIEEIAIREKAYILDQAKVPVRDARLINHTLNANISEKVTGRPVLNFEEYRKAYYKKAGITVSKPDIRRLCLDYLKSIAWVFLYYVKGLPEWMHYYKHHYAPLMTDLVHVARTMTDEEMKFVYEFTQDQPSLPFVQLLSVLPPPSAKLLPGPFRKLLTSSNSPLVKAGIYPKTFEIDYEGKLKEHMGTALLPFVNIQTIINAYTPIANNLKNVYVRNSVTKEEIFFYDASYNASYTSDYGDINDLHVRKM